jgi:DNA-binding response OmpR family regulator
MTLKIANLEVDLLKRRAMRAGVRIDLTAKEFSLLELLMRRRGEVLPKSLIASQVWDMNLIAIRTLSRWRCGGFGPRSMMILSPS